MGMQDGLPKEGNLHSSFFLMPSLGGAGKICAQSLNPGCGLV
jgi:hypothetical protein